MLPHSVVQNIVVMQSGQTVLKAILGCIASAVGPSIAYRHVHGFVAWLGKQATKHKVMQLLTLQSLQIALVMRPWLQDAGEVD